MSSRLFPFLQRIQMIDAQSQQRDRSISTAPRPTNALADLKSMTTVVGDTTDVDVLQKYRPQHATTNLSMMLTASLMDCHKQLLKEALEFGKNRGKDSTEQAEQALGYFSALIGKEILQAIPGHVSTELDARLAFDTEGSVKRTLETIELYKNLDVDKERVFIKLPASWEGIQAARILENEHQIHCNLTLVYSLTQAVACAEAGVSMITTFVGHILDWYLEQQQELQPGEEPGVKLVKEMYYYNKKFQYKTKVMASAFNTLNQIRSLAGCDYLAIEPPFLRQLDADKRSVRPQMCQEMAKDMPLDKLTSKLDQTQFRLRLNDDLMATNRLSHGIRRFVADTVKLEQIIKEHLSG